LWKISVLGSTTRFEQNRNSLYQTTGYPIGICLDRKTWVQTTFARHSAIAESNSDLPTRTTRGLSAVSNILPERAPQPISFIVHFRRIARHSWLIHCPMTQSRRDTDTWSNCDNHSQIFNRRSSACTASGIVGLSLFSLLYCHLLRGALVCLVF